jgi:hypothetical protein
MAQIKALKTFSHGHSIVKRGSSFEVTDQISKDYIKAGLAEEVKAKKVTPPAAVPPAAAPPISARSGRSDRSGD